MDTGKGRPVTSPQNGSGGFGMISAGMVQMHKLSMADRAVYVWCLKAYNHSEPLSYMRDYQWEVERA